MRLETERVRIIRDLWSKSEDHTLAQRETVEMLCDDLIDARQEIGRLREAPERIRNRGNDPYLSEYGRGRYNGLTAAMAYMNGGEPMFLDYSKPDDGSIKEADGTIRFVKVKGHIDRDFSTDDLISGEPFKQSHPSHPIYGSEYAGQTK